MAVADRGYAQAQGLDETVQRGAAVIVRLNPFSVVLLTTTGTPLSLPEALKRQPQATIRTLEVVLQGSGGQHEVRGWMQAYRLNAEQASQARCRCRQRHKKGAPTAASLFLAGWVSSLPRWRLPYSRRRRSWPCIAAVGKWNSR